MKTYILLEIIDEGIISSRTTTADSIREAIDKFHLYPFTWPDDWSHHIPEGLDWPEGEDEKDEFFQEQLMLMGFSYERCLDWVARQFYNAERDANVDTYFNGNYVDGDSNALCVIIEVGEGGVVFYPPEYGEVEGW